MQTLYVQIASYRDAELPRTIASCLNQARFPDRVRIGLCWQYERSEMQAMKTWLDHPSVCIERVPFRESKGCCWARHRCNEAYDGETYTLQIDAHTRFGPWWDEILIDMLESTGADKPLLTTRPRKYVNDSGQDSLETGGEIKYLTLTGLKRDMTPTTKVEVANYTSKPGPSAFLAAGYLFTLGAFCREVPYDPELYFNGEELNLAIRAFTWGYDLFWPNYNVLWHYYGHGFPKHWVDHPGSHGERLPVVTDRLHTLLLGDASKLGPYGLGPFRSVADYEALTGLDFAGRAKRNREHTIRYDRHLRLPLDQVPRRDDYEFFTFCLYRGDQEIYRYDLYSDEFLGLREHVLHVEAELDVEPDRFLLWPKTRKGFLDRIYVDL